MDVSKPNSPLLTPLQLERQRQLIRFNRLTIYLPLGILVVLIIMTIGVMFWLTLFSGNESTQEWQEFSSATADLVIILTVLPMILFAALFPILAAGWFWYTWETARPVETWLQKWLRKTDSFVDNSAEKVGSVGSKVADYSIKYNASASRIGHVFEKITHSVFPTRNARNKTQNFDEK